LTVKRKAVARVTVRVLLEESPTGGSQPNGAAERANANAQGLARTLKDSTERLISAKIPLEASATKWLARQAGWLISNFHGGSDGSTAERRLRRRAFCGKVRASVSVKVTLLSLRPRFRLLSRHHGLLCTEAAIWVITQFLPRVALSIGHRAAFGFARSLRFRLSSFDGVLAVVVLSRVV
jgi:hypothetical protein